MGHTHDGRVHAGIGRLAQDGVDGGDDALGALEAEAFLADVAGGEEPLECFGGVEAVQDVQLLGGVEGALGAFDLIADPALLVRIQDVGVVHAEGPAVGVAQESQDLPQREPVTAARGGLEPVGLAHLELPVEVPDGETVAGRVEVLVQVGLVQCQGIQVGDEVSPVPVGGDEGVHLRLLGGHRRRRVGAHDVPAPLDLLVGNAEVAEDVVVEAVLADEQVVHRGEEVPRLGALDHAVVVGRRQHHDLGDPPAGERVGVGALERRRVVDGSHTHDQPLAGHQPGDRPAGAEHPRVGERDCGAGEVIGGEAVAAGASHQLVVGVGEFPEPQLLGVAQARHQQRPRTVGALVVDGEAQPHVGVADHPGQPVGARGERGVHRRGVVGDGAHDGVGDEVGVADPAAAGAAQVAVDDEAVDVEQLGRDLPEAGGHRDRQAGLHVGGESGAGASEDLAFGGRLDDRCEVAAAGDGGRACGRRRGGFVLGGRRFGDVRAVVGEEVPPPGADRVGVALVAGEHLLDQPGVLAARERRRLSRAGCHETSLRER